MTKEQLIDKIKIMIESDDGIVSYIYKKTESLLRSGAICLDDYENDYRLPKIVISAILSELSYQYRPYDKKGRKETDNLKHFV